MVVLVPTEKNALGASGHGDAQGVSVSSRKRLCRPSDQITVPWGTIVSFGMMTMPSRM
jgi:hypothetical protein